MSFEPMTHDAPDLHLSAQPVFAVTLKHRA
jgi:hypothetical protein